MIKWTRVTTMNNYPFYAYRNNLGKGDVIILKEATEELFNSRDPIRNKSLTNNIEECVEHLASFDGYHRLTTQTKFYQWCQGEGLFELELLWIKKITRDFPPIAVDRVNWKLVTKDLKHFEVLYCD